MLIVGNKKDVLKNIAMISEDKDTEKLWKMSHGFTTNLTL